MKAAPTSWVLVVVLLLALAILVAGAGLLASAIWPRSSTIGFEPSPQPTSGVVPAAPTMEPTSGQTPSIPTPSGTPHPTQEPFPEATSTLRSTPTPAGTPVPAPTQPQEPELHIRTFTASPDPIQRGGTVTLTWDAPGALTVGITRLSEQGDIFLQPEALDLPPTGSMDLQVPEDYVESVKYYLGARDASGELAKAYVTVGIICSYDEYIAPRCPLTQDHPWAAYEPFERGRLIWREDTGEIIVLYDDGGYETYPDTWQEGDPVDIPGTPPPGLYAPVRGFGHLYTSRPQVAERLGWATEPESGYTMWVETTPGGSGRYPGISTYFTLPGDFVVNLYPFTETWQSLP